MEELSFNYLTIGGENTDWLKEFFDSFVDTSFTPIQHDGHLGNVQKGRMEIIDKVTTPFFCFCDPDDRVMVDVIIKAKDFLVDNPDYGMCGTSEIHLNEHGNAISLEGTDEFRMESLLRSPLALHNGTVYRTEMVRELLPFFRDHQFKSFEWALKLVMSHRYPTKKLKDIGYSFRFTTNGHHCSPCEIGEISPNDTVKTLMSNNLIK